MKKLFAILTIILAPIVLLTSCNNPTPPTISFEPEPTISLDLSGKWNAEVSSKMISLFGEEIPYIDLFQGYRHAVFGEELQIADYGTSIVEQYKTILEEESYTLESSGNDKENYVDTHVYSKNASNKEGDIVITIAFFEGDTLYASGNFIQVVLR